MQYCPKCKLHIGEPKRCCPLCQGSLLGTSTNTETIFPPEAVPQTDHSLPIRIASLAALLICVVCAVINLILPQVFWCGFVIGGTACALLTVIVGLKKKHHIFKNISWQLFFATICVLLWDYFTGAHGWSVDYVLPCAYSAGIVFMAIWGIVLKRPAAEYLIYMLLDSLYCLLPMVFFLTGHVKIIIPTAICTGLGLIAIFCILILKWKYVADELKRKMHL